MPNSRVTSTIALLTALAVAVDANLVAQTTASTATTPAAAAPPAAADTFSKEQLEQLVAPIALYADSLLSQILMAATYPLEIVEADRFMKQNASLKGTALDEKLKAEDWDATVKALCTVPDVLAKMSENLDWTQDLGDAFLSQKTELMDTVQRMRGKANDSGNLKTTEQQVVTVQEDKIIVIESPSPEVVYVPTYSPTVVYGGWSYPSYYYPPMYPYYPPGAGLVTFGVGMAMGAAIWGGCNWGWGGSDVNIDVDRYNNFNRNTNINADRTNLSGDRAGNRAGTTSGNRAGTTSGNRAGATSGNKASFQHDAGHRKGVNYKNGQTASKYGAQGGTNRATSAQARGYSGASAGTRQAGTTGASSRTSGTRPSTTASGQGAGTRGESSGASSAGSRDRSTGSSPSASQRSSSSRSSSSSPGSSAYGGSSRSSSSYSSSSRGASSRGSRSYSGGGGGRSGGGGRGGGGRGGRS